MLWVLILAVSLAIDAANLTGELWWHRWLSVGLLVLWIGSLTYVAMRLAANLIKLYGHGVAEVLPVTTLTQTLVQIAIAILGVMILLNQLGQSITPILTALGVGGLAVALALQDTLSNLFAGLYIAWRTDSRGGLHSSWTAAKRAMWRISVGGVRHPDAAQQHVSCAECQAGAGDRDELPFAGAAYVAIYSSGGELRWNPLDRGGDAGGGGGGRGRGDSGAAGGAGRRLCASFRGSAIPL